MQKNTKKKNGFLFATPNFRGGPERPPSGGRDPPVPLTAEANRLPEQYWRNFRTRKKEEEEKMEIKIKKEKEKP